ncbi:MAG: protein kinase [Verrucomicrobiaceae bacterium]|nr:protein kinase [Verrucomicrobiaceae bacterium]
MTVTLCQQCGVSLPTGASEEICPFCAPLDEDFDMGRSLGDCELYEELGRGGMGVVWRGRQRGLDREVAVKTLPGGDLASKEARERFHQEAMAAARLLHPNIVAIHEVGEAEGMPYFIMDLVKGRTLSAVVAEKPVAAAKAARWLRDAALAVQHAHDKGVLHRDLKPSNILIENEADGGTPRVTDFGLAKLTDVSSDVTQVGSAIGSPSYMAPESVKSGQSTPLTDVYGLGAVLYTTLTGRPPFQGETMAAVLAQVEQTEPVSPRQLIPSIPRDLETICLRCLEKSPARRLPSAQALADDLTRFLNGEPVLSRPVSPAERAVRWASRRPALAAAMGIAALALAAVVVVSIHSAISIKAARDAAMQRNIRLHVAEANRRQADGDLIGSLPSLVAALRTAQDDNEELSVHTTRLAMALRQCPKLLQHWSLNGWRDRREPLLTYPGLVYAADFSPDGRWLACATRATTFHFWNTETGEDRGSEFAQDGVVYVKFSADGKRLLTGTQTDKLSLWDVESRKFLSGDVSHTLGSSHPSTLVPPLMTQTGNRLIVVRSGKAFIIETETKSETPIHTDHPVRSTALSQDERHLALGTTKGAVMLLDAITMHRLVPPLELGSTIRGLSFNPNGNKLAVFVGANEMHLCEFESNTLRVLGSPVKHSGYTYQAAWSPDGSRVASAAYGEKASLILNAATGAMEAFVRQPPGIRTVRFSPDGSVLLTAGFDNAARFFEAATGQPSTHASLPHAGYVSSALFSPNGERVFTGSYDGTARLWELPQPPQAPSDVANPKLSAGHRYLARRDHKLGAFGPIDIYSMSDGQHLGRVGPGMCAGIADNGLVLVYPRHDEFELTRLGAGTLSSFTYPYRKAKGSVRDAELSPDGRRAVVTGDRLEMQVWDVTVPRATLVGTLKLALPFSHRLFSLDGRWLATGSARKDKQTGSEIVVWDLNAAKMRCMFLTEQKVSTIQFSPDGQLLAWGGQVNSLMGAAVRVHRTADGTAVTGFLRHRGDVNCMEFDASSQLLATGCDDGVARLWQLPEGKLAAPELRHPRAIESLSFSRDHRKLVTLTQQPAAMRVWDCVTGEAMTPPLRLSRGAWHCRFTDDGQALMSVGDTFSRWPLTDGNQSPESLIQQAELLSAQRQNDITGQRPIPANELRDMHSKIKAVPASEPPSPLPSPSGNSPSASTPAG